MSFIPILALFNGTQDILSTQHLELFIIYTDFTALLGCVEWENGMKINEIYLKTHRLLNR